MVGVDFSICNAFLLGLSFDTCLLEFASFYQLNLKGIHFINCNLTEVDFTETNLDKAVFSECNMLNTKFDYTLLNGADFTTASNFVLDPERNQLQKALFSTSGLAGLLTKYEIKIID